MFWLKAAARPCTSDRQTRSDVEGCEAMARTSRKRSSSGPRGANPIGQDPRWKAVCERDSRADGDFVYSVLTTGVYCRPSCPARTPRPENVAFHGSAAAAEKAGFRPCRRCRPDQPPRAERQAALVADLCRFIEGSEEIPSLDDLARRAGLSPSHTHRLFKQVIGITPHAYARARRDGRMRSRLDDRRSVTEAIYAAGFGSSSRFYETSGESLGMTPGQYRRGGPQTEIRFAVGECSLGSILVAATRKGVCAISLGDDPQELVHDLERRFARAVLIGADEDFERVVAQVVGLVENPGVGTELPLDIRGSAFQRRVWQALTEIPPGKTASYAEIARRIGAPRSSRAVANACGSNPLAVAIPCHRVIRSDGGLAGYRWGVERKRELITRESPSGT
jgi:AraC family transcriptional regulator of adaptative response/methylated-DNA-[protein]-cysteine methyltransferase